MTDTAQVPAITNATQVCSLCPTEAYGEYMGLMLCNDDISLLAKKDTAYEDTRSDRDPICSWSVKGVRRFLPLDPEYNDGQAGRD